MSGKITFHTMGADPEVLSQKKILPLVFMVWKGSRPELMAIPGGIGFREARAQVILGLFKKYPRISQSVNVYLLRI